MVEQPKPETLLSTQESDLPQIEESVPSLQSFQEDSSSTKNSEAKEVNAPESDSTNNVGKPILIFTTLVKHSIL